MTDLQTMSNSLVGVISPIITQLIRTHFIKCNDKAAHWLSLAVAIACVAAAFWMTGTAFTWQDFGSDAGLAFTLSQVMYHNFLHDPASVGGDAP